MRENKKQAALDYSKSIHMEYDSDPVIAYCAFLKGTEWMQKKMIKKACEWLKKHYAPAGFVEDIFREAMEE